MSAWMDALHFLRPHWLWTLLALPALWALWRARQRHGNVWRKAVDAHLLPHLLEHGGKTTRGALWMGALGYVIAILALAGPSWRQGEQPLWQSHAPLVVAVDLSSAISASDLPPSRLLQVRAKLATLLRERVDGQVALVAYAGEAFTVAPLTDDAANVALYLDALEPGVMPVDGQQADKAIAWSVRLLQQAGFERGDILVLADHADAAANRAAADALGLGFRVSVLGVGSAAGAPYRDGEGRIQHARRDAGSLRALAGSGGGGYRDITADDGDLRALGVLDAGEAGAASRRGEKGLAWRDEGYWLLPALMLLALFAFRRGGAFAAILLCVMLPMSLPAQAAGRDWWQRPDQEEHARIEQGADAYRRKDFPAAEKAFAGINSADAHYNHGNALAKQGRYDEAIAAYDRALQQQPKMEDAIENRKVVEAARKRQQAGGQGQNPQKPQNPQPQSQGSQGDPRQGQGKSQAKQDGGQPSPPAPKQAPRQQPAPQQASQGQNAEEAKAQQAADAAQRARMHQAMAQAGKQDGKQGQQEPQGAVPAETAEQREKRQAVEAWLRRVPDDPGGLLKAKFQLEYERRQREGK